MQGVNLMCQWGTDKAIHVIRRNHLDYADGWHEIYVDACIADYVQAMNDQGIITVGCCCGHFKAPAVVLISTESRLLLDQLGYEYHEFEPGRDDVVEHTVLRRAVAGVRAMVSRG